MKTASKENFARFLTSLAHRAFISFLAILATMFGAGTAIKLINQPVSSNVSLFLGSGGLLAGCLLAVSILSIAVVLKIESKPHRF